MFASIDMGGTNTRVAVSSKLTDIKELAKFPTNHSIELQREKIAAALYKLTSSRPSNLKAIVFGVPGILDQTKQKFVLLPNYPYLNGKHFDFFFGGTEFGSIPLLVFNDTAMAAYGEAVVGSGSKSNSIYYLSIGTGVGGAYVNHKSLDFLTKNSEPGHQIICEDGRLCSGCGQHGCLEAYVSGKSFKQIYGISANECNDKTIWKKYACHLAAGLNNIITFYNPDSIVLGGALSSFLPKFYQPLFTELEKICVLPLSKIVTAKLGDAAGVVGGFQILKSLALVKH